MAFLTNLHAAGKMSWFNSNTKTFFLIAVSPGEEADVAAWINGEVFANDNTIKITVSNRCTPFFNTSSIGKYIYETKVVFLIMKLHLIIALLAVSSLLKAQTGNFSMQSVQRYDTHLVSHGETLYSLS